MDPIRSLALIVLAALLTGPTGALAAAGGEPAPGPIDPCAIVPNDCPPPPLEIDPPDTPDPLPVDPWEPVIFGTYKLKLRGLMKHEGAEGFDPEVPQFPDILLGTEEGYALPAEFLLDVANNKMSLVFMPVATPIIEQWLAQRLLDLTGQTAVVALEAPPKVKTRKKKGDFWLIKIKAKGTVEIGGEVHKLRYKSVVGTPFMM